MFRNFDSSSQTLQITHETDNPIAYNLKQLKSHESDQTWWRLEVIFVSKAALIAFSTVVSSQFVDFRFSLFVENSLFLKTTICKEQIID